MCFVCKPPREGFYRAILNSLDDAKKDMEIRHLRNTLLRYKYRKENRFHPKRDGVCDKHKGILALLVERGVIIVDLPDEKLVDLSPGETVSFLV